MHSTGNLLKFKNLGIDTQQELVVFIPRSSHIYKAEGFQALTRVTVSYKEKDVFAALNIVEDYLLENGEISLSLSAAKKLGLKGGELLAVSHFKPVESMSLVRSKIYGNNLSLESYNTIVADIVGEKYSNIFLSAFITACSGKNMTRDEMCYLTKVEQIDYSEERGIDKNQMHRFAECAFIAKKENILITGPTGTGKSFLSSSLGHQACTVGYKVLYINASRLFTQLKMAKADGSIIKEMNKVERQDLLIIDDFGIQPFDNQSRVSLLEIIEDRHGKRSTIITSQLPVKQWYDVIGENTVADAVLDRIVHNAHRIELKGESLRRKWKKDKEEDVLE